MKQDSGSAAVEAADAPSETKAKKTRNTRRKAEKAVEEFLFQRADTFENDDMMIAAKAIAAGAWGGLGLGLLPPSDPEMVALREQVYSAKSSRLIRAFREHPLVCLLKEASEQGYAAAFRDLTEQLLVRLLNMPIPDGVLVPKPGSPGLPEGITKTARAILKRDGACTAKKLAREAHGEEWTQASEARRKEILDSCRQAIKRARPSH